MRTTGQRVSGKVLAALPSPGRALSSRGRNPGGGSARLAAAPQEALDAGRAGSAAEFGHPRTGGPE